MIRTLQFGIVLCVLSTGTITQAAQSQTNLPLRLAIDLVDGSHIIGVPNIKSVPLQTTYAKINIPLDQILSIKIDDDHETASFTFKNGDALTGIVDLGPVGLQTVFGAVSIDIAHMSQIDIRQGGSIAGILKEGLVLHYSFDEDEGGEVTDRSTKDNDGKTNGARWTQEGKRGGAYQFDGKDDVVNAGHGASLDITRDMTISTWVYSRNNTFGDRRHTLEVVLGKDDGSDDTGRSYMLFLASTKAYFVYGKGSGKGFHTIMSPVELTMEQWHHLAVVHKTEAGNKLYVDGKLVAEDAEGSSLPSNRNTDLIIGDSKAWEPWHFYGALDEIMIFNRALSDSEIRAIHNSEK